MLNHCAIFELTLLLNTSNGSCGHCFCSFSFECLSLVCKGFRYYCASGGSRSYENQMQFGKHKVNEAHMRNHVACPES